MDKNQFMEELRLKLKSLPKKDLEDALSYYEEYFEDAQINDYVDVEAELGSPSNVASQILSDYAIKDFEIKDKPKRFNFSAVWFIILAVLASPIALPLGFAFIAVIISLVLAMVSIVLAFGSAGVAIILGGISVLITGFAIITSSFPTFILFLGIGLSICGFGLLAIIGVFKLGSFLLRLIVGFSSKSLNKVNKKFHSREG